MTASWNGREGWPYSYLITIAAADKTEAQKVAAAKTLAKLAITLHDGKDYIDDCQPEMEKVFDMSNVSSMVKCHVGVAVVRMLAHGWEWMPESYHRILSVASSVLHSPTESEEVKLAAVECLEQIVDPDNGSETEQEGRSTNALVALFGETLVTPTMGGATSSSPAHGGEEGGDAENEPREGSTKKTKQDKKKKHSEDDVVEYLTNLLSPLLLSRNAKLVERTSAFLGSLPEPRKRSRESDAVPRPPSAFQQLVDKLEQNISSGDMAQIAAVLKGIIKTLTEAGFEAKEDLCDEDAKNLLKVMPLVSRLRDLIPKALHIHGKKGVTFDDLGCANEERCPDKHFGLGTAALSMLLLIVSSPRFAASPDGSLNKVTSDEVQMLKQAWAAHRYHVGSEFEMFETGVAYIAKEHANLWKSCAAEIGDPEWVCCSNPFS